MYHYHAEKLMQAVRDAEPGTYAKARAWVAYMKAAYTNSGGQEERKVHADMMRRHLKWPLGMRVAFLSPIGYVQGKIVGHLRQNPGKCIVAFDNDQQIDVDGIGCPRSSGNIPFRNLKKINPK